MIKTHLYMVYMYIVYNYLSWPKVGSLDFQNESFVIEKRGSMCPQNLH